MSRPVRWLAPALLALALLPLLAKVPATIGFERAILTYPFQVDDSEGVILSEARWLARGVDPYQPARPDFFTAAPYTPIFLLLNAAAFAAGPFTFKVGRGIALLATLAFATGVGALAGWRTRKALLALWAALAVLTLDLVAVWAVRARPDHLALACNLAGLAAIWVHWPAPAAAKERRPRDWPLLGLAVGCFALGFFTKQTLLAAPAAAGLYLLVARPRLGLTFGALYAGAVLIPFLLIDLVTRGGFYQHIVAFHSSWSAADYRHLAEPFARRYWPLLLGAALLPITVLLTARGRAARRADRDLLPALYLAFAALGSLGAGTHGGNHNHFVETLVVAVLCAALLANRLLEAPRPWTHLVGAVVPVLLSLALLNEAHVGVTGWLARDFRTPLPAERAGWAQVASFVTNDPGPVYSDNVGLLLVAGKDVYYTDPFTLAYAVNTGQWDDRALVARVMRGDFSLIALRYDLFDQDAAKGPPTDMTPALYNAIRARYRVVQRNVMVLYVPLGRGSRNAERGIKAGLAP
ncbi:MAG: hypothetical protein ACTHMA_11745 [Thermomicrobiales bacterium]